MVVDLSALSLASSIVQLIDFAYELVADARAIRESAKGLSAQNSDIGIVTQNLKEISQRIKEQSSDVPLASQDEDAALLKLAESSLEVTDELLQQLDVLSVQIGPNKKWNSFRQAWKAVWKKDRIQKLQDRLDLLRQEMNVQSIMIVKNRQTRIITTLDRVFHETRQLRTTREAEIYSLTEQLKRLDFGRNVLSKEDLDSSFERLQKYLSQTLQVSEEVKILNSLKFDIMPVRYSAITEAHARTFRWIFRPTKLPRNDPRSQIKFATWLEQGDEIFWVSGKPGSGKSTLMKYISDEVQTMPSLSRWAKPCKLVTASFFFWLAGTMMQKSLNGLIQSLLYEVLRACPNLAPVLCNSRWDPTETISETSEPWSLKELSQSFKKLKDLQVSGIKFCFFIDGLDEYDGDHIELIQILEDVSDYDFIKLCVSSRPLNCFERAFGSTFEKKLYLQDLTRDDIALYTREKLGSYLRQAIVGSEAYKYQGLIHEIVDRAQGVFLWVYLVVRSLRDGLINRDSMTTLQMRLRNLPTDLEPFFKHILDSVDKVYQRRLAQMFQIALEAEEPLRLMTYSFMDEEDPEFAVKLPYLNMMPGEKARRQKEMRWRLNGCTKGLLEASQSGQADENGDPTGEYVVDFLHRSVRDFLLSKEINDMLHANLNEGFCASSMVARGILAEVKSNIAPHHPVKLIETMGVLARKAEIQTGTSDMPLVEEIERCGKIRPRSFLHSEDSFLQFAVRMNLVNYICSATERSGLLKTASRPLLELALEENSNDLELIPDPTEMTRMLLRAGYDPNEQSGRSTVFARYIWCCPRGGEYGSKVWLQRLLLLALNGGDLQRGGRELMYLIDHGTIPLESLYHTYFNEALEILLKCGLDPNEVTQSLYQQGQSTLWCDFLARAAPGNAQALPRGFLCKALISFIHHGASIDEKFEITPALGKTRTWTARTIIARHVSNLDEAGDRFEEIEELHSILKKQAKPSGTSIQTVTKDSETSHVELLVQPSDLPSSSPRPNSHEPQLKAPNPSSSETDDIHSPQRAHFPRPKSPQTTDYATREPANDEPSDFKARYHTQQSFQTPRCPPPRRTSYAFRQTPARGSDSDISSRNHPEASPSFYGSAHQGTPYRSRHYEDIYRDFEDRPKRRKTRPRRRQEKGRARRRDTVLPLLALGVMILPFLK